MFAKLALNWEHSIHSYCKSPGVLGVETGFGIDSNDDFVFSLEMSTLDVVEMLETGIACGLEGVGTELIENF